MNEIDYFSDSGITSTRRGSQDTSITAAEKKTLPPPPTTTATIHYKKNKNNYKRRSGSVSDAIEDDSDAQSKQKPRCESISYTMNPLTEVVTPPPTPKPNEEKRKSIVAKSEIKQTPSQATLTPEKPELDRLDSKDLTPVIIIKLIFFFLDYIFNSSPIVNRNLPKMNCQKRMIITERKRLMLR